MFEIDAEVSEGVDVCEIGVDVSEGVITDELEDVMDEAGDETTDDISDFINPGSTADNSQPRAKSAAMLTKTTMMVCHRRFFLYIYFDRLTFIPNPPKTMSDDRRHPQRRARADRCK